MQNKKSYIFNLAGRIIPQTLYLITTVILSRFLSPADFGAVGVLTVFVSLASTLSDSGFGGSLIKENNVTPIDYSTVFVFNLSVSLILYLGLCLFAGHIQSYYQYEGLSNYIYILCSVFVIRSIGIVPRTILTRNLKFNYIASISIISVLCACVLSIVSGAKGWGAYALIVYQIAYALLETFISVIVTKYKILFRFNIDSFKKLFSFSLFTTLCNVIDSIYENLLTNLFGKYSGMDAAGYYSQASKLENASTNSIVQSLNSVSFPILTRKKDNIEKFIGEANSIKINFVELIFPFICIIIVYSKEIIDFLYGNEWIGSAIYLKMLMFVGIFYILENLDRNNIKSLGYARGLFIITIIKRSIGIGVIILSLTISPFTMLYGFILSTAIGYLFNKWLFCKYIDYSFWKNLKKDIKILSAPMLFLIVCIMIKYICNSINISVLLTFIVSSVYYYCILKFIMEIKIANLISKIWPFD